jgi:hypothetical protein
MAGGAQRLNPAVRPEELLGYPQHSSQPERLSICKDDGPLPGRPSPHISRWLEQQDVATVAATLKQDPKR